MEKRDDELLNKTTRIAVFLIFPLSALFFVLSVPPLTGFTISSSARIASGSLLATAVIFFVFLLFLIKIKPKTYKPSK